MNRNEELDALGSLAVNDNIPRFHYMSIHCACFAAVSGVSGIGLKEAGMHAASIALDNGWHFDKESGKALCKKCWEEKEPKQ